MNIKKKEPSYFEGSYICIHISIFIYLIMESQIHKSTYIIVKTHEKTIMFFKIIFLPNDIK